jgi:hypothetical protein
MKNTDLNRINIRPRNSIPKDNNIINSGNKNNVTRPEKGYKRIIPAIVTRRIGKTDKINMLLYLLKE